MIYRLTLSKAYNKKIISILYTLIRPGSDVVLQWKIKFGKQLCSNAVADPDLDLREREGGGGGGALSFFPSVISSFLPKIRGGVRVLP